MTDVRPNLRDMRAASVTRERELATLACGQHSMVTDWQLNALGIGRGAIDYRVRIGRLFRVHPGVYAVGHPRTGSRSRWMAAVLTCGEGALLSHNTAADLWGILGSSSARSHVSVPGRRGRGRREVIPHRVRPFHSADVAERDNIPVTAVARTLLDLAEVIPPRRLSHALEEADRLRLLDLRALHALCDRSPGRHGLKALGPLIEYRTRDAEATHSPHERGFVDFCREHGLPPPTFDVVVEGYRIDATWPGTLVLVELDGWAFHRTRASFESDRIRDANLPAAGYIPIRLTYRRLKHDGVAVAATLRRLLGIG